MLGGYILINLDNSDNLYERLTTSNSKTIFVQYNDGVFAAKVDKGNNVVYISYLSYDSTNCYFNCLTVDKSSRIDIVKKKIMLGE